MSPCGLRGTPSGRKRGDRDRVPAAGRPSGRARPERVRTPSHRFAGRVPTSCPHPHRAGQVGTAATRSEVAVDSPRDQRLDGRAQHASIRPRPLAVHPVTRPPESFIARIRFRLTVGDRTDERRLFEPQRAARMLRKIRSRSARENSLLTRRAGGTLRRYRRRDFSRAFRTDASNTSESARGVSSGEPRL
jgi:hypothetical protein